MPNDEKIEDLNSSADPVDVAVSEAADAISSDAERSDEGDSELLSVVRDVVGQGQEEPEPAASQAGSEEVQEEPPEQEEQDDENFSDVPFNKHPRFRQLLNERNAFKADAQNYRNVQNFIDEQGLTSEEAADLLVTGALAKTNPAEAWKLVKPWVQNLLIAAGEVLPDDLKGMVQRGEIAPQAAMEVSRSRAAVQSTKAQRHYEQQRSEAQRQTEARQALVTTANDWETDRRRKDPNFDAKMDPLMKEVAFLQMREGKPNTPQGVKDQLDRAYKALPAPAQARPAPQQRPAVTPLRGGQVAGNQAPAGQSTLDIIRANRLSAN